MSTMIERVARTICDALHPLERMVVSDGFECVDSWRMAECRRIADAVLAAMREPTEAMVGAPERLTICPQHEAREAWQAMIDEALKD